MAVTAPPRTYAEWVEIFELLKEKTDDEAVLLAMRSGTIEWQTGVAERFAQKLIDAVGSRLDGATDRFQREIGRPNTQERDIIQALLSLRRELAFLANAVNLPAIPEADRQKFYQLVVGRANAIQSSLEDSAKKDRSGKLSSIMRNNKVNMF